jgi:hypothetical protein
LPSFGLPGNHKSKFGLCPLFTKEGGSSSKRYGRYISGRYLRCTRKEIDGEENSSKSSPFYFGTTLSNQVSSTFEYPSTFRPLLNPIGFLLPQSINTSAPAPAPGSFQVVTDLVKIVHQFAGLQEVPTDCITLVSLSRAPYQIN